MITCVEKYRPNSWKDIIGNEDIIKVLKRMIKNGTTQHMIFHGPPGCGNRLSRSFPNFKSHVVADLKDVMAYAYASSHNL